MGFSIAPFSVLEAADGQDVNPIFPPEPVSPSREDDLEIRQPERDLAFFLVRFPDKPFDFQEVLCPVFDPFVPEFAFDEGVSPVLEV